MANRLLLDLEDFVRIINTSGKTIEGRYDGVTYIFPDANEAREMGEAEYTDVHKAVAQHIFGFGLPDQADPPYADRTQCLFRLGWLTQSSDSFKTGLDRLKRSIQFHPIPQFPTAVLPLRRSDESVARVPSPTMGQGEGVTEPASVTSSPADPFAIPKAAKAIK